MERLNAPRIIFVKILLRKPVASFTEAVCMMMHRVFHAGVFFKVGRKRLMSEAYKQKHYYAEYDKVEISKGNYRDRIVAILFEFRDWDAHGRKDIYGISVS